MPEIASPNSNTTRDGTGSTMKSSQQRLLLLTGVVALVFVGPINAHAARIDISDIAADES
jgi:hypothetical protein